MKQIDQIRAMTLRARHVLHIVGHFELFARSFPWSYVFFGHILFLVHLHAKVK